MGDGTDKELRKKLVRPETVMKRIAPGMNIFLSTGVAEPRTLVKKLISSQESNLQDLGLIQLFSFGDAVSPKIAREQNYRLKTFFSGWVAGEAITEGRVDLIPSRFSRIPGLIDSGLVPIDAVFVQVTPPNPAGYCSLGVAVDAARQAMEKAVLIVGEINRNIPVTHGDTFVHYSDFHFLVESTESPIYFGRWPADKVYEQVAANVASVVEDRSCLGFSLGPLYEALGRRLAGKRHLGIHSPFATDAVMDLIRSGAVTNRHKEIWRGKSVVSYAIGTPDLMTWLDRNPLVEFQGVDKVFDPVQIGRNPRYVAVLPARKVDLSGRIALHFGKGNVVAEPGEILDFFNGAELSEGGIRIFALPSRNRKGVANIRLSIEEFPNQFGLRESVDMIITEFGVASLKGRTLRERALALIDVAHPEDRPGLIEEAKEKRILYRDQIYLAECAYAYPSEIGARQTFKGLEVRFRAIKPSDEEEMRRLFYRFSDEAVYSRYFTSVKTMPHAKMQEYVNVDCNRILSIVGLTGEPPEEHIIAEGRYARHLDRPWADIAFIVDEKYQGFGIATFLYKMLVRLGREAGLKGFTADVLASNRSMMKVLEKGGLPFEAKMEAGVFSLTIPL